MLSPKRTKFRKYQKGRIGGIKPNTNQLQFGRYGIKTIESGLIKAKTIEAVRRVMTRKFKRTGQIWIRIFPDHPVTAKPAEVRMGKGKGNLSYWASKVQSGQILYEIDGVTLQTAQQAALLAYHKLPVKTIFIER
jgi:large subunit ribosomal protein L16